MLSRYRRNFVLPNYTPSGWFECDVFELTKAGLFVEYEIKLTRGDFKADQNKRREIWTPDGWRPQATKHARLGAADPTGPSRFYFVCPPEVAEDVPSWAGLIHCQTVGWRTTPVLHIQRLAPTIHREKIDRATKSHAEGVCYWRLLNHLVSNSNIGWETPEPDWQI